MYHQPLAGPLMPISILGNPSMASPWSSTDAGECWTWGEYFFIFQTRPVTVAETAKLMMNKKPDYSGMLYLYSATLFYLPSASPIGPTSRPVLVLGLEQADLAVLDWIVRGNKGELPTSMRGKQLGPLVVGAFTATTRMNLGEYSGSLDRDSVRGLFIQTFSELLGMGDSPSLIGNFNEGRRILGLTDQHTAQFQGTRSIARRSESGKSMTRLNWWIIAILLIGVIVILWLSANR